MEKFFPSDKILVTGNPVRAGIAQSQISKAEGCEHFSLDDKKKTVLVVGGSLGAKSINEAIDKHLDELLGAGLQLVWQTGKPYAAKAEASVAGKRSVWVNDFITQMEYAYAAADIVVARAGAMTVAELCVVKKPVLFVPYPYAAEDHQTVNAQQLVKKGAALMVKDSDALDKVVPMAIELANNEAQQTEMKKNIAALAVTNADKIIAEAILKKLNAK
jgi:UDP-N-acetylglucosamine--N-acetylmuramyl-(pentapeptide) pyrophosphoryl-undecaprenol N-acetylglucosamine transferase